MPKFVIHGICWNSNILLIKKIEPNNEMESRQRNSTFQLHLVPSKSANQTPLIGFILVGNYFFFHVKVFSSTWGFFLSGAFGTLDMKEQKTWFLVWQDFFVEHTVAFGTHTRQD